MKKYALLFTTSICFSLGLQAYGEKYACADLSKHRFQSMVLNGADFSNANLDEAYFRDDSLKKANFKGASLKNTDFCADDLTDANFSGSTGTDEINRIRFVDCKLHNANLEGLSLEFGPGCDLTGANLKKTVIMGVSQETDLSGADLCGAKLKCKVGQGSPPTRFRGAIYNDNTVWPEGFDIERSGAIKNPVKELPGPKR